MKQNCYGHFLGPYNGSYMTPICKKRMRPLMSCASLFVLLHSILKKGYVYLFKTKTAEEVVGAIEREWFYILSQ